MKKYLIALVVIVLVIVGVVYWQQNKSFPGKGMVPCSEEFRNAVDKADVSLCESTTETSDVKNPYYNNACRESCIKEVAYVKGEFELCRLIKNFNDIPHVEGWDDPKETGSYLDYCYWHLAKKLNNVSLCNNVETEWAKKHCSI